MREKELRENANCSICGLPIGHAGSLLFWTMVVERHGIKMNAIRRVDGLAAFLGNSTLAQVMGADEDMTETVLGPVSLTVCESCATSEICLMSAAVKCK